MAGDGDRRWCHRLGMAPTSGTRFVGRRSGDGGRGDRHLGCSDGAFPPHRPCCRPRPWRRLVRALDLVGERRAGAGAAEPTGAGDACSPPPPGRCLAPSAVLAAKRHRQSQRLELDRGGAGLTLGRPQGHSGRCPGRSCQHPVDERTGAAAGRSGTASCANGACGTRSTRSTTSRATCARTASTRPWPVRPPPTSPSAPGWRVRRTTKQRRPPLRRQTTLPR